MQNKLSFTGIKKENSFLRKQAEHLELQLIESHDKIKSLSEIIRVQTLEINRLCELFVLAKHKLFGKKSEKFAPSNFDEAGEITEEEEQEAIAADEEITVASYTRKKNKDDARGGRRPLPENLSRQEIIHELPEDQLFCSCGCGSVLKKISEVRTERLEYKPAELTVLVDVRYKYANSCGDIKMAPLPKYPIPKSVATAGLLSQVIVSKYQDHLPLQRQETIFKRFGMDLSKSMLCHWILKCAELCEPLVDMMQEDIVNSTYVNCDETVLKVHKKSSGQTGRTNDYMFIYIGRPREAKPILVFRHETTRSGEHAERFLEGFVGTLQADGFAGYDRFDEAEGTILIGCFAHARRKFFDVTKATKKQGIAHEVIELIKQLYNVEQYCKDAKLGPDRIKAARQDKSVPVLAKIKEILEEYKTRVPPKSSLGNAIGYSLKRWAKLTYYINDGYLDIDNNIAERGIRPFVVGRKNWLFAGNERGAKAGAVLYSLIETCKANNVNTFDYFKYILEKLPYYRSENRYRELLPYNIKDKLIETNSVDDKFEKESGFVS